MNIAQKDTQNQSRKQQAHQKPWKEPRRERRPEQIKYQKKLRRMRRTLDKMGVQVDFDNKTVTSYGNFQFLEQFKTIIGLRETLDTYISLTKGANSTFPVQQLLDLQLDALIFGLSRFTHLNALKSDPGYLKQKELERFPDERTFRGLYDKVTPETLAELELVNLALIHRRAEIEGAKEVWVDVDDTVITLFGEQEEGKVGYNPRYHGRPSLMLRMATIHETKEILAIELLNGRATGHNIQTFLEKIEANLPRNYVLAGIRADCGFFDEANLEWAEDHELDYLIKVKQNSTIKTVINYLTEEDAWEKLDDTYSVAEARFPLKTWKFARRFVFIREKLSPKNPKQLELFPDYKYRVIITFSPGRSPEEVWHDYNQRCDIENCIEEFKYGFAADEESQQRILKNRCYVMVKAIAYNIIQWFKAALLPAETNFYKVDTIRRLIINVPGNIVSLGGGYKRMRLAANKWLEEVVRQVEVNIREFAEIFLRKIVLQT